MRDARLSHNGRCLLPCVSRFGREPDRPTAILVSPIHEAQIVRADDGKDHVEYELLAV
jgi:hypothetical protein